MPKDPDLLETLKHDLFYNPSKSLLIAAKYAEMILGDTCPDWAVILANGNPDRWESVIDVARDDITPHGDEQ